MRTKRKGRDFDDWHAGFVDPNTGKFFVPNKQDALASVRKQLAGIGQAYGFFYYPGKTADIRKALPYIRAKTETPDELVLDVIAGVTNVSTQFDPALEEIIEKARRRHLSHVLRAQLPGLGNRRAANFLGNVMTGVYKSLYNSQEPFYAGIVYKRGYMYVFRGQ